MSTPPDDLPVVGIQRLLGGRFYRIHIKGAILSTSLILTGHQARYLAHELVASGYFDEKNTLTPSHFHDNPDRPHDK